MILVTFASILLFYLAYSSLFKAAEPTELTRQQELERLMQEKFKLSVSFTKFLVYADQLWVYIADWFN
jgi:hypothetical protein